MQVVRKHFVYYKQKIKEKEKKEYTSISYFSQVKENILKTLDFSEQKQKKVLKVQIRLHHFK